MTQRVNFGDPTFEPTDEQLQELSREAFVNIGTNMREALDRMRIEIARLRAESAARVLTTMPQPA